MSELDHSFAKLLGKQPSDAERQNLYRVREALDLKNNDAMWLIVMALQHYKSLYENIPNDIEQVASRSIENVKMTADAVMRQSAEETKLLLAKEVAKLARDVAHNTSRKQMWRWAFGCLVGVAVVLGVVFWFAHDTGKNAGYAQGLGEGYAKAQDEKAAATWANTPEGKMAYRLAQKGSIDMLFRCDGPGWYIKNGVCFVNVSTDGKIYGWSLP
jgi:hypothetical protein